MTKTTSNVKDLAGENSVWNEEIVLKEIMKELLKVKIACAMKKRMKCSTSHIGYYIT